MRLKLGVALLGTMAAVGAAYVVSGASASVEAPPPVDPNTLPIPGFRPEVAASPIGPEPDFVGTVLADVVRRDEPVSVTLGRLGVTPLEVDTLVRAMLEQFDFRRARPGNTVELLRDAAGAIVWFRFTNGLRGIYHATRQPDGSYRGHAEAVHVVKDTVFVRGEIEHSLYLAMSETGESAQLTMSLVDLFAWDIDFYTETQKGDRFALLVEKEFIGGRFAGYGKILGAEYAHPGPDGSYPHKIRAFHYTAADGTEGYYTAEGTAVKKAFLKSPIQFASITSGFGMRRHPILEYVSQHKGIDYGAPRGTAIWAVADGVVSYAGPRGGYGNVVFVRHPNGYETRYAHMSGFAKGIRTGVRVAQKSTLGYVGSTGLSTGPHLHFEVLIAGRHTNPLSIAVPPAAPIKSEEMPAFQAAISYIVTALGQ